MEGKKVFKRLRFQYEDDLALLREFVNVNPIVNQQGWKTIQQHLYLITGKQFLIKTLKSHIFKLLEEFLKKVVIDQVRSGIEEPQNERNTLLQEVNDLCKEYNYSFKQSNKTISKEQKLREIGKNLRDIFAANAQEELPGQSRAPTLSELREHDYIMENMVPTVEKEITIQDTDIEIGNDPNISIMSLPINSMKTISESLGPCPTGFTAKKILGPIRRRTQREPLKKNAPSYLKEKNERDINFRNKELQLEEKKLALEEQRMALEERKIAIEEKKIEMDHRERMERIQLDRNKNGLELEEKKNTNLLIKTQQVLIDNLLKKIADCT